MLRERAGRDAIGTDYSGGKKLGYLKRGKFVLVLIEIVHVTIT